jgi:hypothetical protein
MSDRSTPSPHYRRKLAELFEVDLESLGLLPPTATEMHSFPPQAKTAPHVSCLDDPLLPPRALSGRGLVGRADLVDRLRERLVAADNGAVVALQGLPGVGKTALALEVIHDALVRAAYPDGVLWAGLGPASHPEEILMRWAGLLGLISGTGDTPSARAGWRGGTQYSVQKHGHMRYVTGCDVGAMRTKTAHLESLCRAFDLANHERMVRLQGSSRPERRMPQRLPLRRAPGVVINSKEDGKFPLIAVYSLQVPTSRSADRPSDRVTWCEETRRARHDEASD